MRSLIARGCGVGKVSHVQRRHGVITLAQEFERDMRTSAAARVLHQFTPQPGRRPVRDYRFELAGCGRGNGPAVLLRSRIWAGSRSIACQRL